MNAAPVDYQFLYEQLLQEQQEALSKLVSLQEKVALLDQVKATNQELEEKLALALFELQRMRRKLFGRSADNRAKGIDPNQIPLFDLNPTQEELQSIEAETKTEVEQIHSSTPPDSSDTPKSTDFDQVTESGQIPEGDKSAAPKKTRLSKIALPTTLPKVEVVIHPEGDLTNYFQIGEEVTELLELLPPSFQIKRIIRTKWALKPSFLRDSKPDDLLPPGVIIAPIPSRTVAKGLLGESLLTYLVISKYLDHLPLYRQMKIFERMGVRLAASTLSDNVMAVGQILEPLYHALKKEVLRNLYLQVDETTIRVLDQDKKGASHLGYFWS